MKRIIISSIMGILLFSSCTWFSPSQQIHGSNGSPAIQEENVNKNISKPPAGIQTGLIITSPAENDVISSGVAIRGYANGEGWTAFEGEVGTVSLLDANGNPLVLSPLPATTDWMRLPVYFETKLLFPEPQTDTGTLLFKNENASGMPESEKEYRLPVRFSHLSAETTTVQLYFGNNKLDPEISCNKVFEVSREASQTPTIEYSALSLLFAGPTTEEKKEGYTSFFGNQTKDILLGMKIAEGTAYVNLKDIRPLIPSASSSCGSAQLLASVTKTLTQFPAITKVIFAINRDPKVFYDWIQVGCNEKNNNCDKTLFQ